MPETEHAARAVQTRQILQCVFQYEFFKNYRFKFHGRAVLNIP